MTDPTPETTFAGKLLVRDGGFLVECSIDPGVVAFHSYKLDGSFVTRVEKGWLFVEGGRDFGQPPRQALFEDGADMDAKADGLAALGVRKLPLAEAQAEIDAAGASIINVTAEERARAGAKVSSRS